MNTKIALFLPFCALCIAVVVNARDCIRPALYARIVGNDNRAAQVGEKYVLIRNFTGNVDQLWKHCPNPDGSISFVGVSNGKCHEIPDCKENEPVIMTNCNGGINQEFVYNSSGDLSVYAMCNPELYVHSTEQNTIAYGPKEISDKFEVIIV